MSGHLHHLEILMTFSSHSSFANQIMILRQCYSVLKTAPTFQWFLNFEKRTFILRPPHKLNSVNQKAYLCTWKPFSEHLEDVQAKQSNIFQIEAYFYSSQFYTLMWFKKCIRLEASLSSMFDFQFEIQATHRFRSVIEDKQLSNAFTMRSFASKLA